MTSMNVKRLQPVLQDFDERVLYTDDALIAGVKQSQLEAQKRKGKILKSDQEMDEYFKEL